MKDKSKYPIYFFMFLGIALRLIEYFHNKSLWLDETYVALNAMDNSFLELFGPLDLEHQAPIFFMLIQKAMILLFGVSEYSLRAYPLACGIGSVLLFYKVSRYFLEKEALLLANFLFAICPALIHYSSEGKPYSGDVFITLLIYLVAVNIINRKTKIKYIVLFSLLGMVSIWTAYSSVFVLAGVGLTILITKFREKNYIEIKKHFLIYSTWAMSFLGFYFLAIHRAVTARYVVDFFTQFYIPHPFNFNSIAWLGKMFMYFLKYIPMHEVTIFFLVLGLINYFKTDSKKAFLLTLPIPFALFASYLHQYPLWQRCLLFIIPGLLILSCHGWHILKDFLFHRYKISGKYISYIFIFFIVLIPTISCTYNIKNPRSNQEVRESLKYLKANLKNGDTIYLHKHLQYGYKFYAKKVGLIELEELESPLENENIKRIYESPEYTLILGMSYRYNKEDKIYYEDLAEDLPQLKGKKRVWMFLSNMKNRCYEESKFYIQELDKYGRRLDFYENDGIEVYLYDLSDYK